MKTARSRPAALIAGGYLLLTLLVMLLLLKDGYIGHGNGLVFIVATALTLPLSLVLILLTEALVEINAFYMTGWPYFLTLCELGAGALLNAGLIHLAVSVVHRRWRKE